MKTKPLFPNLKTETKVSNITNFKQPVTISGFKYIQRKKKKNHFTSLGRSKREKWWLWNGMEASEEAGSSWASHGPAVPRKGPGHAPGTSCSMFRRRHLKAVWLVPVFWPTQGHIMPCGLLGWQHVLSLCTPECAQEHGLDGHLSNQSSSAPRVDWSWQPKQQG